MQAAAAQAPYRSVSHAVLEIVRTQGFTGLYRVRSHYRTVAAYSAQFAILISLSLSRVVSLGLAQGIGPNVQRAMLVGLSQPPSYDEAKHRLIAWHVGDDHSLLVHSLCVPPASVGASRCSLLTLQ